MLREDDIDSSPVHNDALSALESASFSLSHGRSITSFWNSTLRGKLECIPPAFDQLGRKWSKEFELRSGNNGELETSCGVFGVKIAPLAGVLHRTSVVTLLPRFVVVNRLDFSVYITPQSIPYGDDSSFSGQVLDALRSLISSNDHTGLTPDFHHTHIVDPGDSRAVYHFPSLRQPSAQTDGLKRCIVLQSTAGRSLSDSKGSDGVESDAQPIVVDELGQQYVWLAQVGKPKAVVCATVSVETPCVYIVLQNASAHPPYRIENRSCTATLVYKQVRSGSQLIIWIR